MRKEEKGSSSMSSLVLVSTQAISYTHDPLFQRRAAGVMLPTLKKQATERALAF